MILAIALFETPSLRNRRISSSLPSRRDTPSDPFGRPSFLPVDLALASHLTRAFGDQVALELGEQGEQRGHDLRLDVLFALDTDVLLDRDEGDGLLREGIEDGDDLTQRSAEPGQLGDDQLSPGCRTVISSSSRRRVSEARPEAVASIKSSMWKSCLRAYSRMARRWLPASCCAVETRR